MKMHVLSGGRLRVRKAMYDGDAPRGETLDVPVSCILLRHGHELETALTSTTSLLGASAFVPVNPCAVAKFTTPW